MKIKNVLKGVYYGVTALQAVTSLAAAAIAVRLVTKADSKKDEDESLNSNDCIKMAK